MGERDTATRHCDHPKKGKCSFFYDSLNRAEITLKVIILDDKLNVELSAKSTDSCGHLTFRQKIQGERKILIVINANMNWKVPVSDIINLEWPIKQPSTRERSTSADPIWRCRSDQRYGKVPHQPPRKTIWPPTLEPNWASQLIDEIMPGKLLILKALNLNGLTNSHPRRPLASTGTRTPTTRSGCSLR